MKTCPHCGGSLEEPQQNAFALIPVATVEDGRLTLSLVGGGVYPLSTGTLEVWKVAYPGVDLPAEIAKMNAWLASNPKKGKTRKGILRFANSWLSKAQDESSRNGNGRRAYGFEAEREQIARVIGSRS